MPKINKKQYALIYGPTVKDRFRLADTSLIAQIEKDFAFYGEESKFGIEKNIKDGMSQSPTAGIEVCDLIITNVIIIDYTGIIKADIGIKNGKIHAIGKSGNSNNCNGITPGLEIGANTEILSAEGKIITAGGIDSYVHFISPGQVEEAMSSGITTMIGGGTGPNTGINGTTCTPGEWNINKMIESVNDLPLNFGFMGKGNSSNYSALASQVKNGAMGLKLHEDWGTTPKAINTCMKVADNFDVQVAIHTDNLNESGFLDNTIAAFKKKTIHAFHSKGDGGYNSPDITKVAGLEYILPSSTNPTLSYTKNIIKEPLDMMMICRHLDPKIPESINFIESKTKYSSISAEDVLHDIGAISITSSDSQAMGRVGEVIIRTWQVANSMKMQRGALNTDNKQNDNNRIKRYIAKYTINPAIAYGISDHVGSIEVGKIADLVLWDRAFFGVKPERIIKGGFLALGIVSNSNNSIPISEPNIYKPMFGSSGKSSAKISSVFVSKTTNSNNINTNKNIIKVENTRNITKRNMKLNDFIGNITINPNNTKLKTKKRFMKSTNINNPPMSRRYFLF